MHVMNISRSNIDIVLPNDECIEYSFIKSISLKRLFENDVHP